MAEQPKADPPDWILIHLMAKEYGIAPWEVEEMCTHEWLVNWLTYRTAEAEEQKRLNDKMEKEAKSKRR